MCIELELRNLRSLPSVHRLSCTNTFLHALIGTHLPFKGYSRDLLHKKVRFLNTEGLFMFLKILLPLSKGQ